MSACFLDYKKAFDNVKHKLLKFLYQLELDGYNIRMYADDTILLVKNGIKIKWLVVFGNQNIAFNIKIGDDATEKVTSYKYLGCFLDEKCAKMEIVLTSRYL